MPNVEIVSTETIKPSSTTPENLRILQLSLLDELSPTNHTPIILFYSSEQTTGKSSRLKKSLSDILTRFYPFAGRLTHDDAVGSDYDYVECNDEGVEFYEARVDGELSDFLQRRSDDDSNILLLPPIESPSIPLLIQFNVFNCGGSAIGVFLSHKIGDGVSLAAFINGWADATRIGGDAYKLVSPTFGFASLFPPRRMQRKVVVPAMKENPVTKRLLFEASKIALLKEKVNILAGVFPSRAEAVTSLIWRCALTAQGEKGLERKLAVMHVANIRGRIDTTLPEYSIGNLIFPAIAIGERVVDDRRSDQVGFLEGRLREAIQRVDGDFVREWMEKDGVMTVGGLSWNVFNWKWHEDWEVLGFHYMIFASWCRFPFYESDFGWGKPESLSICKIPVKDNVILLPSRDGGIEAWVSMVEEEMEKFQQDPELLDFISYCIL